jgi:hypothetical protein
MSKLRSHRGISRAEFVNTAIDIRRKTRGFLARLSARYARLMAADTMHQANLLVEHAEGAQSMRPTDLTRYEARKGHLLEARAALKALDDDLEDVYQTLMMNPEGAFDDAKKTKKAKAKDPRDVHETERAAEAIQRLDRMSEELGCLIDAEDKLLTNLMDADRRDFKKSQQKARPK